MRWLRRAKPYLLALSGSTLVVAICVYQILSRAGEPALPLDDAFIHLQYARRLAEGHWFSYTAGAPYSSGATSMLWPLLIAPFFWLGLDGLQIIWVVWGMGALLHAAVAYDTGRLCAGLTGRGGGVAAAAMCLVFGAFAWFGLSGMETMGLAWMLARGGRVAAEHRESARPERLNRQLVILGLLAPLVRPEGLLVSLMASLTAASSLRKVGPTPLRKRLVAVLLPLLGPVIIPSSHALFTGQMASSTATVKWLWLDPYLSSAAKLGKTVDHVALLLTKLLNGDAWTAVFLPEYFGLTMVLGVPAIMLAAHRRRCWWRAFMVMVLVMGTLLPCTYATMLWNRVRYIWPFAPGWFVLSCCFFFELAARLQGRSANRAQRGQVPLRVALGCLGPAGAWALVALLAAKLPWAVTDLATSARAITLQQVKLGRWASTQLPTDAIIGVNDTGAIAYLSGRRTFDVVGLTTPGQARYWAAGAASRFEHYERRLRAGQVGQLPTHFIVYRNWMAMPAVLGAQLSQATVLDQSILGGRTMIAAKARYDWLEDSAKPFALRRPPGRLLAELDVADLESERLHAYELGDARAGYQRAAYQLAGTTMVADGGRRECERVPRAPRPGTSGARLAS